MNGMGADIYNAADRGRFVYKQLSGNGSIIARVDRLDNTNDWAKAGVMIRETLEAGSTWAYSLASPSHGVHFQVRLTAGGNAAGDTVLTTLPASQTSAPLPMWVKVERNGNAFNAYYSSDGVTWTPNPWNPQTIAMGPNVYIGLAVTSHAAGAVTQAELSSIATTGNVTGAWQSATLGTVAQPEGNTLDPLYVTVKDSIGKSVTLKHPDAGAVTTGIWQQWQIPLSSLTGISPGKIKSLIIGVGDPTNPQRGAGKIYIDDIQVGRPVN
jgi:regulation of enolase protein 1 (concanavalin A-like superfamily)